jgi:GPI transamidase subunit PIG-U
MSRIKFGWIIIIGLIVRLAIAPFLAHPSDVFEWYVVGQSFVNGSTPLTDYMVPYGYSYFLFVFPATLVYSFLSHFVPTFTFSITSISPQLNPGFGVTVVPGLLFNFLVKLPLILSDTLIAFLIFEFVRDRVGSHELAVTAAAIWYLNPFVIWISSAWGMFDTLPTLFTLLAFYLVIKNKPLPAGAALVLAFAMKYYALVLFVPMLLLVWRRGERNASLKFVLSSALTGLILFVPLLGRATSVFTSLTLAGSSPVATLYPGLSFWTAVTTAFPSFNQAALSTVLLIPALGFVYYWSWHNRKSDDVIVNLIMMALPILMLLLLYRWVGENFFVWILPFLSIIFVNDSRGKKFYWLISLTALVSSVTDSLLPYYLLPLAPWIGDLLSNGLSTVAPYRTTTPHTSSGGLNVGKIILSSLGLLASILLVLTFFQLMSVAKKRLATEGRAIYQKALA